MTNESSDGYGLDERVGPFVDCAKPRPDFVFESSVDPVDSHVLERGEHRSSRECGRDPVERP